MLILGHSSEKKNISLMSPSPQGGTYVLCLLFIFLYSLLQILSNCYPFLQSGRSGNRRKAGNDKQHCYIKYRQLKVSKLFLIHELIPNFPSY